MDNYEKQYEVLDQETIINNKLEEKGYELDKKYLPSKSGYAYEAKLKDENNPESGYIYNIKLGGEILNLEIESPEKLLQAMNLTDKILTLYKNSGYDISSGEKFYVKEGFGSNTNDGKKLDLYINNRPTDILDTVYLSEEKFFNIFQIKEKNGIDNETAMELYSNFLNKTVGNIVASKTKRTNVKIKDIID